ncbi:MAG TPA: MerR family transcriptional regulator [Lachnospiraceae bacterium]|nr:MerR family transcriptional regulator [Lachnospiraceae bacterium]
MMTVNEVSKLTGVSIRTLQYYDRIGLLPPAEYTEAGYRLYDDASLETLQQILLFRELQFPLKDIREIIGSPDYDRSRALGQQIELLKLKKEHIENLIDLAIGIKAVGVKALTFDAFDTRKIDEYAAQAKASWGTTPAYKEFEEKSKGRTKEEDKKIYQGMIDIFAEFGAVRNTDPASGDAQALVKKLQDYITEHMYTCTKEILGGLGRMYGGGGDFTTSIDSIGGEGTAVFAARAIEIYCG